MWLFLSVTNKNLLFIQRLYLNDCAKMTELICLYDLWQDGKTIKNMLLTSKQTISSHCPTPLKRTIRLFWLGDYRSKTSWLAFFNRAAN